MNELVTITNIEKQSFLVTSKCKNAVHLQSRNTGKVLFCHIDLVDFKNRTIDKVFDVSVKTPLKLKAVLLD